MKICECCGQEVRDDNVGPRFGGRINLTSESIFLDGQNLAMFTKNERFLIEALAKAEGRPVSQVNLLNYILSRREWNDNPPLPKIVDVYVCKIRKKIENTWLKGRLSIITIWGVGWAIELDGDNRQVSARASLEQAAVREMADV